MEALARNILVLQCQLGDEQAFGLLMAEYHPRLRFFVRRLVDCPQTADDVLQDVWLTVFRRIGTLTDSGALVGWLYAIARHKAWHVLRRRRDWSPIEDHPELAIDEPEPEFGPEEAACVHVAMGQLKPEYREILTLRFLEDMTYEQMAELIGCAVGTAKSRMHYAKKLLRREIERTDHDSRR